MKKLIISLVLIFMIFCVFAEEKSSQTTLTSSDWLHLTAPAGIYLTASQGLQLLGCNQETSEYCGITITLLACIGKEYYDYRMDGASTYRDLELGVISVITSYYSNKAINEIFRPQKRGK